MKNLIPYLIIAVLVLILIWKFRQPKEVVYQDKIIKIEQEASKQFTDNQGQKHTTFEEVKKEQVRADLLKDVTTASPWVDSSATLLKIAKDKILELTRINIVVQGQKLQAQKMVDSLKRVAYKYENKYISLAYNPPLDTDTTDGTFDYKYTGDLNWVKYNERAKILGLKIGTKKTFTDFYLSDTNAYVLPDRKHLIIQQEQPSLVFHVQGVATYDIYKKALRSGAGIQLDIKRISLQGSYLFDYNERSWSPVIQGRVELVGF